MKRLDKALPPELRSAYEREIERLQIELMGADEDLRQTIEESIADLEEALRESETS